MNTVKKVTFSYSHTLLAEHVTKDFVNIDGLIWGNTLLNITRCYGRKTSSDIKFNLIDQSGVRVPETSNFTDITDYLDNQRPLLAYATLKLSEPMQSFKYLLSFYVHSELNTNEPDPQNECWWVKPKKMVIEYDLPSNPVAGVYYKTELNGADFKETVGGEEDLKNGIFICTDHAPSLANGSLQILKWYYNLDQCRLRFFCPERETRVLARIRRHCASYPARPICGRIPSHSPSPSTLELTGDDLESLVTEVGIDKFQDQDWKEPVLFKTGRSNTYSEKAFGLERPARESGSLIQI